MCVIQKNLFHYGASGKGVEVIRKLLAENNCIINESKSSILCLDNHKNIGAVQNFLGFEGFAFLPLSKKMPIDISKNINKVIILPHSEK